MMTEFEGWGRDGPKYPGDGRVHEHERGGPEDGHQDDVAFKSNLVVNGFVEDLAVDTKRGERENHIHVEDVCDEGIFGGPREVGGEGRHDAEQGKDNTHRDQDEGGAAHTIVGALIFKHGHERAPRPPERVPYARRVRMEETRGEYEKHR
eukprot:1316012-Amorphochlora_amoeboformis.AAC.1